MTTTCDLHKVQYARFGYTNGAGTFRSTKPRQPTVHGEPFNADAKLYGGFGESMLSFAKRNHLLDTWRPVVRLQFAANHSVVFIGHRAQTIWREWQARIFGKKGKP